MFTHNLSWVLGSKKSNQPSKPTFTLFISTSGARINQFANANASVAWIFSDFRPLQPYTNSAKNSRVTHF